MNKILLSSMLLVISTGFVFSQLIVIEQNKKIEEQCKRISELEKKSDQKIIKAA